MKIKIKDFAKLPKPRVIPPLPTSDYDEDFMIRLCFSGDLNYNQARKEIGEIEVEVDVGKLEQLLYDELKPIERRLWGVAQAIADNIGEILK